MTVVLADIERHGVRLDRERVKEEYDRARNQKEDSEGRLLSKYSGVNFASSKQLSKLLYETLGFDELRDKRGEPERTAGGARRTDEDTIHALKSTTQDQQDFKEYFSKLRHADTQLRVLDKMQQCCKDNPDNPILTAAFNQTIAANHRLTSTGRNYGLQLQNVAREYKKLFRSRYDDWYVGEADGMQLEFRAGADLTKDPVAIKDIKDHVDVHINTASTFEKKKPEKVTKEQRQKWKPETFRPMYGSKGKTKEQKRYAKYFHNRYSVMHKVQTDWTFKVLETGKLVTPWGLIFYWPGTTMQRGGYIDNTTNIFNYPISSLATAEWIPISVVYTWHFMKVLEMMSFLVNTIHDSIISEVAPHERDLWTEVCKRTFTVDVMRYMSTVYNINLVVPLGVEIKYGTHWSGSNGGECKFELDPSELSAA